MKPLALDPGNYAGTYKLIGEELAFDFINTISWKDTEWEHDWLNSPGNFISWSLFTHLIDEKKARSFKKQPMPELLKDLKQVHLARNDLRGLLMPLATGTKPPAEAFTKLNSMLLQAAKSRHIDRSDYKWSWAEPSSLPNLVSPIAWNAAHIITELDHSRIRCCPGCNWIFYDQTRSRSRRWCDMGDCGSRDKALRYYHRQQDENN
jgi:predicted RNA-binding Zn ribbon-like protein